MKKGDVSLLNKAIKRLEEKTDKPLQSILELYHAVEGNTMEEKSQIVNALIDAISVPEQSVSKYMKH